MITDEAVADLHDRVVTDFRRHGQYTLADARAALEAAAPLLGPRPLLDQQAAATVVYTAVRRHAGPVAASLIGTEVLGPLMELARPMPTPEQIAEVLRAFGVSHDALMPALARRDIANAVLALLNGDAA